MTTDSDRMKPVYEDYLKRLREPEPMVAIEAEARAQAQAQARNCTIPLTL